MGAPKGFIKIAGAETFVKRLKNEGFRFRVSGFKLTGKTQKPGIQPTT
jgi:hypothetical protein